MWACNGENVLVNKPSSQKKGLKNLVVRLEEDAVLELVKERIKEGDDPFKIIAECNAGMQLVGEKYEKKEYFASGLIMAGEIFREMMALVTPFIEKQGIKNPLGTVLLGTVAGDIHDLGKNIAGMLLSCHGFEVIDLGVDVPAQLFAEKAHSIKPNIVGLSGLLTSSHPMMKETVIAIRKIARRFKVQIPIVIGGGMIDECVCQFVGADYWVNDAMTGVRLCESLMDHPIKRILG
jgi:methanogenic corrinoid protein MtbC1